MSPLDAEDAIIANNKAELDYGPMLILRHDTKTSEEFYTFYGHLCLKSLAGAIAEPGSVFSRMLSDLAKL